MSRMPFEDSCSPMESLATAQSAGLKDLLQISRIILLQARDLLFTTLASDDHLTYKSKLMPGSTIGKHLRHARDHFELLLDCLDSGTPYIYSYDKRMRNTPMESSLQGAYDAFTVTLDRLDQLLSTCETDTDQEKIFIKVGETRIDLDQPMTLNAVTPHLQALQTTFGRELWFAGLHAIHHWSMIRVVAGELDIHIDGEFGVAPSTILYRNTSDPSRSKM